MLSPLHLISSLPHLLSSPLSHLFSSVPVTSIYFFTFFHLLSSPPSHFLLSTVLFSIPFLSSDSFVTLSCFIWFLLSLHSPHIPPSLSSHLFLLVRYSFPILVWSDSLFASLPLCLLRPFLSFPNSLFPPFLPLISTEGRLASRVQFAVSHRHASDK